MLFVLVITTLLPHLSLAAVNHATSELVSALDSPCLLLELYKEYVDRHQHTRPPNEERLRLKLFSETLKKIVKLREEVSWEVGVTLVSDFTESEQSMLRGYNATALFGEKDEAMQPVVLSSDRLSRPAEFDEWRLNGNIGPIRTQVKDSCWANAAVVPLEAQLSLYTRELKQLSVQELYDCTYPPEYKINGVGGTANEAWRYVHDHQRLGLRSESPETLYKKRHPCEYSHKTNAIAGYEVQRFAFKVRNEDDLMDHLRIFSPIKVSVDSSRSNLLFYLGGLFTVKKGKCGETDHAVVLVGYTTNAYTIRNSWGTLWGNQGYVKWDRNGDLCGMLTNAWYPFLQVEGAEKEET